MIEAEVLTRRFGPLTAVDRVSFTIERGRVAGFLGPNGAGKTTTMSMLAGVLTPTSGRGRIDGHDLADAPRLAHACLGWLPEGAPARSELRVDEYLYFRARLFGAPRSGVARVMGQCGLEEVRRRVIGCLSRGFRQRVALAAALVHDPAALMLDEPSTGLDPVQQRAFRALIQELAEDRAILFSTHQLGDALGLCDDLLIIGNGCLRANQSVQALREESREGGMLILESKGIDPAILTADIAECRLISASSLEDGWIRWECDASDRIRERLATDIASGGGVLRSLERSHASLESWVQRILGGEAA